MIIAAMLLAVACGVLAVRARRARSLVASLQAREQSFRLALWASGQRYWDFHVPSARLQYLVARHEGDGRRHDFSSEQAEPAAVIHPDDLPGVVDAMHRYAAGETAEFSSEHRVRADSPASTQGQWTWIRARGRAVERQADGAILRVAGTSLDISATRAVERENRIASEVLRSMNEAVAVLDDRFRFLSVNPAFTHITGHGAADVIGRGMEVLDSVRHDHTRGRIMREALRRDGRWSGEMWQRESNGEELLCAVEAATVREGDAGGERMHVLMLSDITLQKRAEEELRYVANFDSLTNLPNRSLLAERLSRAIVHARRDGSRVAVLFLDLDRFKDINDSLGHAVGDRILRAAAARLQQAVGPGQTVARLAGDEFTVILEGLAVPEDAERVAREIIMAFEAPLVPEDGQEVSVSASIGVSLYPDHAQVPTELLKRADAAMYQAKAAGRRTWMRYDDSMEAAIRRRAILAGALHKALDRGELRVVYQPRQALASSRITGAEALLRWTSPEHGEIPPADFIPLAEENGMILEIGEWVLREACLAARRWRDHGLSDVRVSVNMSVLQLLRGDFADVVRGVLDDTGIPAQALELELTESMLMANAAQTAHKLQAFRELGVSLAIDDFGTGYSSLAYLKRLPITTIKIDKTFIADVCNDREGASITTTVIAMAHGLGLTVVAEGVETADQARFLARNDCDEIQGFWVSQPLDAVSCMAYFHNHRQSAAPATASTIGTP
ncbi:putative bifunctional diguanylate cyclase/phosphodiesterase [Luteimonas changyuni]|uniref:putative bifunctional diguanylate cyclase/phosphodiesterase n=1 Tax=Luteimonas sp. MJ145 TaxID=3129234 RepID=UPI0031BB22FA